MSIWTQDITKNVYFRIAIGIVVFAWLVAYGIDYFSIEKRCQREVGNISVSGNKLLQEAAKSANRQLVQECIENARQ